MERLERLVNLVAALIDADRPLTRAELRSRVGGYSEDVDAFRRNFERDKETLRQMGLPLVTAAVDGDGSEDQVGYRIPRERYELDDPGLSEEELAALRIAASSVRMDGPWGGDATTRSALRKLAGASGPTGTAGASGPTGGPPGRPAADPAGGLTELAGGEAVTTAFGAIAERRRLSFRYRGEERSVDPWRLAYRTGRWYLSGLDHARGEERLYRLDRIETPLVAVGEPGAFELPAGRSATSSPAWQLGEEPETEVTVLVDGDQARWAVTSAGEDAVVARRPDGSVDLVLRVTNREALRSWLLGFLDHAELLGPPDARDELVAWLASAAGESA